LRGEKVFVSLCTSYLIITCSDKSKRRASRSACL
jgi:hypothetical protein